MVSIFFFFQNLGFLSSLTYLFAWFIFFCSHMFSSHLQLSFPSFHFPNSSLACKIETSNQPHTGCFPTGFLQLYLFYCFLFFCCATICQTRYANIFVFCFVLLLFVVFFDRRSFSAFCFFFLTVFLSFPNIVSNDGGDEQEELSFFPEK